MPEAEADVQTTAFHWVAYEDGDRSQWDAFARAHGTLFHGTAWKEVLEESFGYLSHYQMILDAQGQIAGILPLCTGRNLTLRRVGVGLPFVSDLDICGRDDAARDFIISQLPSLPRRYGWHYLECRFRHKLPALTPASLNEENFIFLLPLQDGEAALMARAAANNRRCRRRALQHNRFSVSFDFNRLTDFYRIYQRRQKQLGSPAPSMRFFQTMQKKLPHNVTLLTVADEKQQCIVGGMFLIADQSTLHYLWGATLIELNDQYLNHFMYWEAIKFAVERGFAVLDLGRSPYQLKSGAYHFKARFGASPTPLHYYRFDDTSLDAADAAPEPRWGNDKGRMAPLIEIWKKLPAPLTTGAGHKVVTHAMP